MLQNARTHEDFDKSNAQIASELERGEQWTAYKNSILENVVADKNKRKAYGLGMYVNGPSSSVTVRYGDRVMLKQSVFAEKEKVGGGGAWLDNYSIRKRASLVANSFVPVEF